MYFKRLNSGYLPFIKNEGTPVLNTLIQNRAKVGNSLKCSMGVERLHVNSLNKLLKESGPNGESVYEPDSSDSRIRFVGNWETTFGSSGLHVKNVGNFTNPDQFLEVTFYGTGLNLLGQSAASNTLVSDVYIDGAFDSSLNILTPTSNILNARNYKTNNILPVAKDLALGWHTVRMQGKAGNNDSLFLYGFDVINASSSILIQAGKAHGSGYEYIKEASSLTDYKTGFDNVLDANVGTRGGRAVVYLDPTDVSIKKRLTKVDAAAAYLASANHANEAPYRSINFREFGRNRADDFSTLAGVTNRAFTLDDGSTMLIGNAVTAGTLTDFEAVRASGGGSYLTIAFTGTGLDIISASNNASARTTEIIVDGVSVGNLVTASNEVGRKISICSGLPYGSHLVKFLVNTNDTVFIRDFIIYQPKKPSIPDGAVQLADYNIVADFDGTAITGTGVADNLQIAAGVFMKHGSREFVYEGAFSSVFVGTNQVANNVPGGGFATTSTNGDSITYHFFGDRIVLHANRSAANTNITVAIDGALNDTGVARSNASNDTGGAYTLTGTSGDEPQRIEFSGLGLGFHTIIVTRTGGSNMNISAFLISSPIHSPSTTFGSQSLKDLRNFDSARDINKEKVANDIKVFSNTITNTIKHSKGISQILKVAAGQHYIYFEDSFTTGDYLTVGMGEEDTVVNAVGLNIIEKKTGSLRTLQYRTDTSGPLDKTFNIEFKGKLQKDEYEE